MAVFKIGKFGRKKNPEEELSDFDVEQGEDMISDDESSSAEVGTEAYSDRFGGRFGSYDDQSERLDEDDRNDDFDDSQESAAYEMDDSDEYGSYEDESESDDPQSVYDEAYDYDDSYDYDAEDEDQYDDDTYAEDEDQYDDYDAEDEDQYDDYDAEDEDQYDDTYAEDEDQYDDDYDIDDEDRYDDDYDAEDEDAEEIAAYDDSDDGVPKTGFDRFLENNDWLTYASLFLLPPLGIFFLLKRKRFQPSFRYSIAAASGIWCVLVIAILTQGIGHRGDKQTQIIVATPAPTSNVVQQVTLAPDATDAAGNDANGLTAVNAEATAAPTATPNVSSTVNAEAAANLVWTSATGSYYHNKDNCPGIASTEIITRVTIENAQARGKYACPVCYGGTIYYATSGGSYYHTDSSCSGMKNPQVYTLERAKAENKAACPVCITKTATELPSSSGSSKVVFLTQSTTDKSGVKVWISNSNSNYHVSSSCSGIKSARQVTLKEALLAGKTSCKTCCAASGTLVYCTSGGRYYHSKTNCSGMENASAVTLSEALVLGKQACPTCKPLSVNTSSSSAESQASDYYVYATVNGKYYHIKSNCSGMSGAQKITLKQAITLGKSACPTCCSGANTTVYAASGNQYYHSYATCSGMKNAKAGTLAYALALGLKRCPVCWQTSKTTSSSSSSSKSSSSSATSTSSTKSTGTVTGANATVDNVYVYATKSGAYYHTRSNCSGLSGATKLTLRQAISAGKKACPTCSSGAYLTVYSTSGGKYYHKNASCSGMSGAKKRTLQEAMQLGQTACPVCLGASSSSSSTATVAASTSSSKTNASSNSSSAAATLKKVANYKTGTSGISVYASVANPYYHSKKSCSGLSGLASVPLETALNYGKTACPKCATVSSIKVYATQNGKYYHLSKTCAGAGAASNTLAAALAYGFSPCPYCVTGTTSSAATAVSSGTYSSGTSGVNVYATAGGAYYHSNKTHAGSGAISVPLEIAMNYGKTACPTCCAIATATVYASSGDKYFHINKSHAGSNAVGGSLAKALAIGLKPCPSCSKVTTGANSSAVTAVATTAEASSIVYIDLYASTYYYHSSSKCAQGGESNGQGVTLEYAKDFGYIACPFCHPPTSIG